MSHVQPPCPGCAIADDHPRHQCALGTGIVCWHTDCHAAVGCPLCVKARENAPDGQVGAEHQQHLIENGPEIAAFIDGLDEHTHNQVFGQVS
jgi:hypothetical protein